MLAKLRRYLILGLGWFFVVLRVPGILLPRLQGILFLLVGFILVSQESEWVQRQLDRLKTQLITF